MVTQSDVHEAQRPALGLRHVAWVYTTPSRLFGRIEDTGAYGLTLVFLLAAITLLGYITVQTGLIDRMVDQQTEKRLAEIEHTQRDLVDRVRLQDAMQDARKAGQFAKTLTRWQVIVLAPLWTLASFLLIAAVLYAVVALTGRKPEYHTLMSICVYAGFIELIAHVLRVGMMLYYRTIDVDTSLAVLAPRGQATFLAALDPFVVWYWILVMIGLAVTRQLSRRMAVLSCTLLCLVSMSMRVAMSFAAA